MIPKLAKRLGLAAGAAEPLTPLARRLLRDHGVIFMLHRFRDPSADREGHDPADLRRSLAYLRAHRYELVSLEELFRRLGAGPGQAAGAIAFTIDDGYLDQATIGAPVFAEFDCPVTTFVTTGFLDGALWFWWDRVAYVFAQTHARGVRVRLGEAWLESEWSDAAGRARACEDFTVRCKSVSEEEKQRGIIELAAAAGVPLPDHPPREYAPMSWDDLRRCEERGMSFGPHTVTHPILSRTADAQSEREIVESWRRLKAEARRPSAVFCYPNGQLADFGEREIRTLAAIGMLGAVVGEPGYAGSDTFQAGDGNRFKVPRYAWPDDVPGVFQYVGGIERMKQLIGWGA